MSGNTNLRIARLLWASRGFFDNGGSRRGYYLVGNDNIVEKNATPKTAFPVNTSVAQLLETHNKSIGVLHLGFS